MCVCVCRLCYGFSSISSGPKNISILNIKIDDDVDVKSGEVW